MSVEQFTETKHESPPVGASFDADVLHQRQEEAYKDRLDQYVRDLLQNDPKPNDAEFLMDSIAGFSPTRLVARFIYMHEEMTKKGLNKKQIREAGAAMVDIEARHFAAEFLYRSPILQTQYEIRNLDGVPSVVQPNYDPYSPLHTHVSMKEREGAVFNGVRNLEDAILEAKGHSTIVYASTLGWNGTGMPFVESQVHVVNIVDGQIIDTTLRNSLSVQEIKKLVEELSGQEFEKMSERELIKEISQTVISFPTDITPEQILNHMQIINKKDTAWRRMKLSGNKVVFDRSFSFDEIKAVLERDSFLETNAEVNNIISELTDYLTHHADIDEDSLREMVRRVGRSALLISESIGVEVGEINERKADKGDYSNATKYAAEGLGCDPSGSSSAREAQYKAEGIDGRCVQCGEYSRTICGWCIKCAEAGENYKLKLKEKTTTENEPISNENIYGAFLGLLIAGALSSFSKN